MTENFSDAFEGTTGIISAANIKAEDNLRIAIVGKVKTGKSWCAASGPKPTMVYDFDGRAESLRGKEGVFVKTLIDLNQNSPTVVKAIEADLSNFKYRKELGKPIPRTFVFDSITYLKKAAENELMSQNDGFARKIKLAMAKSLKIPQGWDVINGVRGFLEYIVNEFNQLGNVIFVFHEQDEKDKAESTPTVAKYTGRSTVSPQYLESVLALFNETYFMSIDYAGNYVIQCQADATVGASTTLLLDKEEKPDIMALIKKHKEKLLKEVK